MAHDERSDPPLPAAQGVDGAPVDRDAERRSDRLRSIAPPDGGHRCNSGNEMGGAATVPEGTLRQCPVCGRWWRSEQTYRYWTEYEWLPVRWWQWRLRSRIRRETDRGEFA